MVPMTLSSFIVPRPPALPGVAMTLMWTTVSTSSLTMTFAMTGLRMSARTNETSPMSPLLSTDAIGAEANQPTTGDNRGRYSNKEFDDLLKKAQGTPDEAERNKLYQQAEKIAIGDDLALIPMWNGTQHRLANTEKFINMRMDFNENPDLTVISIK